MQNAASTTSPGDLTSHLMKAARRRSLTSTRMAALAHMGQMTQVPAIQVYICRHGILILYYRPCSRTVVVVVESLARKRSEYYLLISL
jgi:hypothetical protein